MVKPFGQETHEEREAIRARLEAEGNPSDYFAVERVREQEALGEPTFADRQWWLNFRWGAISQKGQRRTQFTREEMQYLLGKLEGVNDPLGIRCADILRTRLSNLTKTAK